MQLSEEQKSIIESKSNFIQVIAGAGSGKTSTMVNMLTSILQKGDEKEEEILVITFTRKAKEELSHRLEKIIGEVKIQIHTFHSYCLYIIQKYHPEYKESKVSIISPEEKKEFWRTILKNYKSIIGGIPYEQLFKENSNILNKYFPDLEIIIKEGYRIYKLKEKKLDFDDLVSIYLNAQRNSEDWAFLAKKEIKRIIVDEFQDTDLEQLEWLKLLSPEKLTVVGDDWQAIYSFRGATIEPFLNFPKYFPDTEILYLTTNYRSLHDIIEVSKTPILKNANNIQKITKSYRKEKAGIFKFYLNKEKDWNDFLVIFERENLIKYNPYILSRTNYRLQQLKKLGFPEDRLITIHKSKGLEFETVILDLFDGWSKNDSGDDIDYEEERRILYVGLSRAMNNLILIGNKSKSKKCPEGEFFYYFKKSIKEFPPGDFYKNLNKLNSI